MQVLVFVFCLLFSIFASAKVELSRNLNPQDRLRAIEILGYGSAPKLISNSYPLGGYKGVEISATAQIIPLDSLADLGDRTGDDGQMTFHTLTLGKGLFYNVDGYIYFTPFNQNGDLQSYGAMLKWAFYEIKRMPVAFSVLAYGGGSNFSNVLGISTLGVDLVTTLSMDWFSLYGGVGSVRAIGKFVGGASGLTDSPVDVTADIVKAHSFMGIHFQYSDYFIAGEVDIYADTFYSAKVGMRF